MKISTMMLCASMLLFVGCDKKNDSNSSLMGGKGNILVTIMQPNSDGMDGSMFMTLLNEGTLSEGIDLSSATPIPYNGAYPMVFGNDIFITPSFKGDSGNNLTKYTVTGGVMSLNGNLELPPNSLANNIVMISDELAYLALSGLGKVYAFNPKTMTKLSEIDLNSLANEDNNPDLGAMVYRNDGYLFVGLNQLVGGYTTPENYTQADVAIINTKDNTLVKMIYSDKSAGLSQATYPIDPRSIFMDEKGDIYVSCTANYGWSLENGHKAGFLRIKNGTLEVDNSYNWATTDTPITGEDKPEARGVYNASTCYAGNGIVYGYIDVPAYYQEGETSFTAFANRAVKYDLYNKTLNRIEGAELSNGYGTMFSTLGNDIVMANFNRTSKGIYKINKLTNSIENTPIMITPYNIIAWSQVQE